MTIVKLEFFAAVYTYLCGNPVKSTASWSIYEGFVKDTTDPLVHVGYSVENSDLFKIKNQLNCLS